MLFNEKFSGKNISRRRILSHTNKKNDKGQTNLMFSVIANKNKENIHFGWVFFVPGTCPLLKTFLSYYIAFPGLTTDRSISGETFLTLNDSLSLFVSIWRLCL